MGSTAGKGASGAMAAGNPSQTHYHPGHSSAFPSTNRLVQPFTRHLRLDHPFRWLRWLSLAERQQAPKPPDQRALTTNQQRT